MLTRELEIPNKPQETGAKWSVKNLLSLGGSIGKVVATFNPIEFILFVVVLMVGIAEIFAERRPWFLYIFSVVLLFVALAERRASQPKPEDKK